MNSELSLIKVLFEVLVTTIVYLVLALFITALGLGACFGLMVGGYGKAAFCALLVACAPWIFVMGLTTYSEFLEWRLRKAQRKRRAT